MKYLTHWYISSLNSLNLKIQDYCVFNSSRRPSDWGGCNAPQTTSYFIYISPLASVHVSTVNHNPSMYCLSSVLFGSPPAAKIEVWAVLCFLWRLWWRPHLQLLEVVGWIRLRAAPELSSSFGCWRPVRSLSQLQEASCIPQRVTRFICTPAQRHLHTSTAGSSTSHSSNVSSAPPLPLLPL